MTRTSLPQLPSAKHTSANPVDYRPIDYRPGIGRSGVSLFAEPITDAGISFEFFPPKTPKMEETLWDSVNQLAPLYPSFVSVTYGAGGSTRERTHALIKRIQQETTLKPAAHLTCVDASRGEVDDVVRSYLDTGVKHIVALRGDSKDKNKSYSPHPEGYINALDLVKGLRKMAGPEALEISVAAYPECHPDSPNLAADLDNLKAKVDAGATRAITQFFFNADSFFRYRDHCVSCGIDIPIIPGILPITNVKALKSFAASCGTHVPLWIDDLFDGLDSQPDTRNLVAATVAAELCRRLYLGGVKDFHFYTLNRAELTRAICHMLGQRAVTPDNNT